MPCMCVLGCTCAGARQCMSSGCIGAPVAAANVEAMSAMVNGYHRMWYPDARRPGEPSPAEQEEIRGMMRDRDEVMLQKLQERLEQLGSETPEGLLRSEHHLDRERAKLKERIRRLQHEISILSEE